MDNSLVFDMKRYAINDGPGIRITIFLKGCPLSCAWCHNPESQSSEVQLLYTHGKCIGCSECVRVCRQSAASISSNGIFTDSDLCVLCGDCTEVCPTKARELAGKLIGVEEVMTAIEKERVFFEQSGGGVTFSGGEPLSHPDLLIKLLDMCGEKGIHRVVDTAGLASTDILLSVAERTDIFLYDLKMMDSEKHLKFTGVRNEKILENLQLLAAGGADIIIRIPLIKNVNDDSENITQTALFIASLSGEKKTINILPYHNIAVGKYKRMGEAFDERGMQEPSPERLQEAVEVFAAHGLIASIGG